MDTSLVGYQDIGSMNGFAMPKALAPNTSIMNEL
jgi:hypothetical protein